MSNYIRLQQALARARDEARKFMENIALVSRTIDSTATIVEEPLALPAPGPILRYLEIFTPTLLYFIDQALKDWEVAPEELCSLSCDSWMESHILNMQAKTSDGRVDNFYYFITQFDYERYFSTKEN